MAPLVLIQIEADELDTAAGFYTRVFGLIVGRRRGSRDRGARQVIELIGGSTPLHLITAPETPAAHPPVQVDLVVEDIEGVCERARRAGARPEGGVRDHTWGSIAQLVDPFGNRLCLLQFRRRGLREAPAAWIAAPESEGERAWPRAC